MEYNSRVLAVLIVIGLLCFLAVIFWIANSKARPPGEQPKEDDPALKKLNAEMEKMGKEQFELIDKTIAHMSEKIDSSFEKAEKILSQSTDEMLDGVYKNIARSMERREEQNKAKAEAKEKIDEVIKRIHAGELNLCADVGDAEREDLQRVHEVILELGYNHRHAYNQGFLGKPNENLLTSSDGSGSGFFLNKAGDSLFPWISKEANIIPPAHNNKCLSSVTTSADCFIQGSSSGCHLVLTHECFGITVGKVYSGKAVKTYPGCWIELRAKSYKADFKEFKPSTDRNDVEAIALVDLPVITEAVIEQLLPGIFHPAKVEVYRARKKLVIELHGHDVTHVISCSKSFNYSLDFSDVKTGHTLIDSLLDDYPEATNGGVLDIVGNKVIWHDLDLPNGK